MIAFIIAVLVVIIAFLLVALAYLINQSRQERAKLINAVIAKNAYEARDLTLADKTKIEVKPTDESPDLIPENQVSDEDWEKAIHKQVSEE